MLTAPCELHAFFVDRERLLEGQLSRLEALYDLAQARENLIEARVVWHARKVAEPSENEKTIPRNRLTHRLLAGKLKVMGATSEANQRQDFRPDDTGELKERWRTYIQDRRLNTTAQREAIVELFLRTRDHVSIDDLLSKVRKRQPKVGYATVYRTLKLLVDSGLAVERQFGDGQARYEVVGDHHDHLICMKCGLILEFEDDEIEQLQEKIAARLGNFRVMRHRHELYALCPKAAGEAGGGCPKEDNRR